jgi:plasmid stabilization system protein ParE
VARSRFFPPDNVTHGEWTYLLQRFGEREAKERRARVRATLKRLVKNGKSAKAIHEGMMRGIRLWPGASVTAAEARRYNAKIARVRKDVARALAGLRSLVPTEATVASLGGLSFSTTMNSSRCATCGCGRSLARCGGAGARRRRGRTRPMGR